MDWASFSIKWFTLYYPTLGLIFFFLGCYSLAKTQKVKTYLIQQAEQEKPPPALRNLLKYFFLFTIPTLILSFIPFSWIELLFSLWSLTIIYVAGIQLVRWEQTRIIIMDHAKRLPQTIRITGATIVAVSLVIMALGYLVIKRIPSL
ncbi:MAG: hypothetical protein U5J95_07065 [Balneolaceae bacterium]|nr:hypothetical protein [Balneolaceae bacterium]